MQTKSSTGAVRADGAVETEAQEPFVHARIKQKKFASPIEEAVISLMVAAYEMKARIEHLCSQFGITQPQYNVLRILRGVYPQGHPRYEISTRMVDRAPDVTRLIDRLERQGLVERVRSLDDMRLSISRITPRGLQLLEEVQPHLDGLFNKLSDQTPVKDQLEIARLCRKLCE